MTTYPAGLSKISYLNGIRLEGVEVGNYTINDSSTGRMPNYAMVYASGHIPASQTSYNYISWTSGTHTGPNVILDTSSIPQCLLLCTVTIAFNDSVGSLWNPNNGVLSRIERSTDGGITFPQTTTQYFTHPIPFVASTQQGGGPLAAIFTFSATAYLDTVIRFGTQAYGYNPSTSSKQLDASMRILVFNQT